MSKKAKEIDMIANERVKKAIAEIKEGKTKDGIPRNQTQLAAERGVGAYTQKTISNVINNKCPVSQDFAKFIASIHENVRTDYLMNETDFKTDDDELRALSHVYRTLERNTFDLLRSLGFQVDFIDLPNDETDMILRYKNASRRFHCDDTEYNTLLDSIHSAVFGVALSHVAYWDKIRIADTE